MASITNGTLFEFWRSKCGEISAEPGYNEIVQLIFQFVRTKVNYLVDNTEFEKQLTAQVRGFCSTLTKK